MHIEKISPDKNSFGKFNGLSEEIFHYYDSLNGDYISQSTNHFYYSLGDWFGSFKIEIPLYKSLASMSRLGRRAMRLDKGCCVYSSTVNMLIIFYQFSVYTFDIRTLDLKKKLDLGYRNPLFGGVLVLEDKVFFGEYYNNKEGSPMSVWCGDLKSDKWSRIFNFDKKEIHHVHGIYHDEYTDSIWICTGDFNGQCKVIQTTRDFSECQEFGDGSQKWRAVTLIFFPEFVLWGMDSPLETSHIIKFDRTTKEIEKVCELPGSCWYAKKTVDNYVLLQTSVEHSYLPGIKSDKSFLFVTSDSSNWKIVESWKKDRYPNRFFRHGVVMFCEGNQYIDRFVIQGEALESLDGKPVLASIKQGL
jgi:hypothetical protein